MRSWMIAFSLGIFFTGFIPSIPAPSFHSLALIIPVLSLKFCRLRLAGAFLIGIFWFLHCAHLGLNKILPEHLEGADLWVTGRIVSLPQKAGLSQRFEFLVTASKQKLLLNVYQEMPLKPGQTWRLKVRLKRPHGFSNPGGFDYEGWLFQNEINATGYIRADPNNRLLHENTRWFDFLKIRDAFRDKLKGISENKHLKNTGLIKALSIGDRFNITDQEWTLFTNTGTNHLIVISGLHVGLVALLAYRLSLLLLNFSNLLLLKIPAKRIASMAAILAAFFYAGLAGFSLPAQRAFIMVAIFMLGQCLYRNTAVLNTYCLALGLVLILDPLAPQSSGFWLSFGAVGILILFSLRQKPEAVENISFWQKSLVLIKTQGFLFLGLLPLMLVFFQQVSLLAPLVNILAIPFISLLVVPLCLAALVFIWVFPAFAGILLLATDLLLSLFKYCLQSVLSFPFSQQTLIQLPALSNLSLFVLVSGIGVLLFLPNAGIRMKIVKTVSLSCFIPLYLSRQVPLENGVFTLDILDAGQGLAILLSTSNHHMIYDTGPAYSPRFNAGSGVILPFIRSQNINSIDKIMISHGDNDHSGGLAALLPVYPNAEYLSSDMDLFITDTDPRSDTSSNTKPNTKLCQAGQEWHWDEVHFQILHPTDNNYRGNNSSCVLKISSGGYSALLSGDIERRSERALLRNAGEEGQAELKANILIAPHHGSKTSSTQKFVEAVSADYVVFASGYLNRFHHPHPDVVERYRYRGTKMLNTAYTGALHFEISPQEGVLGPISYRKQRRRYWSK